MLGAKSEKAIVLLLLVCYFLFFFRIGARDLWNPDEPRYAQVAREMLETGEWVLPHLNGEVYPEKPPLYFWLVALASKPIGDVTETTARLPSAVAATLVVLLTYLFGTRIFGRREAFAGAIIMATSAQYFWIGRNGVLDILLTLSIFAALAMFYLGYEKKRFIFYTAGFVFLVPAALSKGPVGIAVPVLVMLVFLLVDIILRKEGAKKQLAWFGLAAVVGVAIVALFVVPWWREAYERSGGTYGSLTILTKQTAGRMFESYSHRRPFHYYFGEILWQFLPWGVFAPLAVITIKKKGNLRENRGLRFLLIWFMSVFILFTLISGKRSQYLLPLFPAGGLIFGWALMSLNPEEGRLRERREFSVPLLVLALLWAVGLVVLVAGTYLYARQYMWAALATAIAGAIVLFALYRLCIDRPPTTALGSIAVVAVLLVVTVFGYIVPIMDHFKSARPFCATVLKEMREGDGLFFYKYYRPNIHYYMHRRIPMIENEEELIKVLSESDRVFLIYQWKQKDALAVEKPYVMEHVIRSQIGSRDVLCTVVHRSSPPPSESIAPITPSSED